MAVICESIFGSLWLVYPSLVSGLGPVGQLAVYTLPVGNGEEWGTASRPFAGNSWAPPASPPASKQTSLPSRHSFHQPLLKGTMSGPLWNSREGEGDIKDCSLPPPGRDSNKKNHQKNKRRKSERASFLKNSK